jgi:hypothetical protein
MSSFTRDLVVRVSTKQVRGRTVFIIEREFEYAVGSLDNPTEIIRVPVGYETDFVSIPAWARMFINNIHRAKAAVIHDRLLTEIDNGSGRSAKEADRIFREALAVLGAGVIERNVYYRAVRCYTMMKQLMGQKLS